MLAILIPIVAPAALSFYDSCWYSYAGMTRVNARGGWPAARIMNRAKGAIAVATVRRSLSVHTRRVRGTILPTMPNRVLETVTGAVEARPNEAKTQRLRLTAGG